MPLGNVNEIVKSIEQCIMHGRHFVNIVECHEYMEDIQKQASRDADRFSKL